jgi:hypothetical protein
MNDKGRSHQQPQPSSSGGSKFRADATHSRRASEITGILEAVVARKAREIAIARAVDDRGRDTSRPGTPRTDPDGRSLGRAGVLQLLLGTGKQR